MAKFATANLGERGNFADKIEFAEARLKQSNVHVFVFTEAYGMRKALLGVARRHGYKLRQQMKGEGNGLAVLIREDCEIKRCVYVRMKESWVGPHMGRKHDPRVMVVLVLVLPNGEWWQVFACHFAPGGPSGPNRDAWHEQWDAYARRAIRFDRNHIRANQVLIGDINAERHELVHEVDRTPVLRAKMTVANSPSKVDHFIHDNNVDADARVLAPVRPHPPVEWTAFRA